MHAHTSSDAMLAAGQEWTCLLLLLVIAVGGCSPSVPHRRAASVRPPAPVAASERTSSLKESTKPGEAAESAPPHAVAQVDAELADGEELPDGDERPGGFVSLAEVVWESTAEEVEPAPEAVSSDETDPSGDIGVGDLEFEDRDAVSIDLGTALAVATGRNPQVAFAQERIREALADVDSSEILWLPSLRAGLNYHARSGNIQNTEGRIINRDRSALFTGLGSRAVGGGSVGVPGVWADFHLADAVFQPRIADHAAGARRHGARAMLNDTLLQVAVDYQQLLRALQELSIAQETVDHTLELARATDSFADAGMVPQADADRAYAEAAVRRNAVTQARERLQVASSRLARSLSGDPATLLVPDDPAIVPLELVSSDADRRALVERGLLQRPELAKHRELVAEALERFKRQRFAPLVPSVILGMTYGGLGGSAGRGVTDFDDRFDFDVAAWWEVRQLGLGEGASRRAARSRADQTRWQQVQLMDQVAQEVSEAATRVRRRQEQIPVAQEGVQRAIDSHRRNMQRIQQGEGLPLEALHSIGALDQARREYLRTVIEFNQSQFRLQHALGWPIESPGR